MSGKRDCIVKLLHNRLFAVAIMEKLSNEINNEEIEINVSCNDMDIKVRIYKESKCIKSFYLATDYDFKSYKVYDDKDKEYGEFTNEELVCWALDLSPTIVSFNEVLEEVYQLVA